MKAITEVPNAVVKRLPRYKRILKELLKMGKTNTSSAEISALTGFTASQIRQDLNNFGTFGMQGHGYEVWKLYDQINRILGLEERYNMIVVGAGNLGQAIAHYTRYYKAGFPIIALFDVNPRLIGLRINDIEVMDFSCLPDFLRDNRIDIGIITTNKDSAQAVADYLVIGGVRGIWNFAMTDLSVPEYVAIEHMHLSDSLYLLTYQIQLNEMAQISSLGA